MLEMKSNALTKAGSISRGDLTLSLSEYPAQVPTPRATPTRPVCGWTSRQSTLTPYMLWSSVLEAAYPAPCGERRCRWTVF